jgi:coproporphyrinogen III oxidase
MLGVYNIEGGLIMEMGTYYSELNKTALEGFKQLNKTRQIDEKTFEIPSGRLDICVVRGNVLEKAATARIQLSTKNPVTGEDTQFDIFQVKIYPANPKIPILLLNIENRTAQEDRFYGFLDVVPVAASIDDLDFLHSEIRNVTSKYGENYEALRKRVEGIYKMDHWDNALNAGIGMRLEISGEQVDFVQEAALTWLNIYLKITAKRVETQHSKEDALLMYAVRARIMEFYMLKDMSFKVIQELGITADVMGMVHFAPVIKY